MASSRLAIQNRIITTLSAIRKTDGYNNDVDKVSKVIKDPANVTQGRYICVAAGQQIKRPVSEDAEVYEVHAFFQIIGYVKCDQDVDDIGILNDACDGFIEDIETALLKDDTIFTTTEAKSLTVESDMPVYDDNGTTALVFVGVDVVYYQEDDSV